MDQQPPPDPPQSTQAAPTQSSSSNSTPTVSPEAYESQHVHDVYEAIAPHFSATRHRPWPRISSFLTGLPPGSIGLDVGCGNGKYLPVNPHIHILGSDRSASLLSLARQERNGEVLVADTLNLPYRPSSVDFVICIAVIHHLSTEQRRRDAIRALLDRCRTGGRVLVFVWALEQGDSRRGWDEGSDQDTLVSWVMRQKGREDTTYQRYYHLYRKGELEADVEAVGGKVEGIWIREG